MKKQCEIKEGMIFGKWKIIQKDLSIRKDAHTYWLCQCECGNIKSVRSTLLRNGKSTSCGCVKNYLFIPNNIHSNKIIDISNKRFGKVIALYPIFEENKEKLRWQCKCDCGTLFLTEGESLRKRLTESCGCSKISKGEQKIAYLLTQNNISFQKEYSFETCRFLDTNRLARFDFWVNNCYLIEYDGIQHFKDTGWKMNYDHDIFKNNWCKINNIPLIRIPYTKLNTLTIDDIKLETSNFII